MENNRRRDSSSSSLSSHLAATRGCDNELTLSESDSSLIVENRKVRFRQFDDLQKDCHTAWTDEKHDLYLDHLESSFVEQLYRSVLNRSADSRVEKIHHRCASKQRFVKATKLHVSKTNMIPTEFSDQNFADEANEQICGTMMSKRPKTNMSEV